MTSPTLALVLEQETLDEALRAFAPRVGDDVVFFPGLDGPLVGARVAVSVTTKGGDVALTITGLVAWRYPIGAVPPGREAGMAVLIEEADEGHRARLAQMRSFTDAGQGARAPGSRLPAVVVREARVPRVDDAELRSFEFGSSSGVSDAFEIRTSDFVLAEHEGRLSLTRVGYDQASPSPRALPSPLPVTGAPLPRPALSGVYFAYEYDERHVALGVKHLERFEWPYAGTLRPAKGDIRTYPPGTEPPGDLYDDEPSSWDEVTDDQRGSPLEVSDPGRKVTDVVRSAVEGFADVDLALAASPRRAPPPLLKDGDEAEVTETDVKSVVTESGEAPVGTLPTTLRVRVNDDDAEELFAAGAGVPTSTTCGLTQESDSPSVKLSLFEGEEAGFGRHLGTVRVKTPRSRTSVDVRFDVHADGFLEVRAIDDPTVRQRFRTSWAAPCEYPRPARRQGWLARLLRV